MAKYRLVINWYFSNFNIMSEKHGFDAVYIIERSVFRKSAVKFSPSIST